ncbi:MAG: M20 family metallopeptidase [Pseudomonadota bacterium]|nr:M20 family metallopeptidase [Pseudomonadota bacterium]
MNDSSTSPESKIFPLVREWRRHLHRHPELSGQEQESAHFISQILTQYGIEHQTDIGGHGIVAWINRQAQGPDIAFRADFDALPLNDHKKTDYASTIPGVMHACAHDGHAAVLLGLAVALAKNPQQLSSPIRLIFQPAEENGQGAIAMLKDGLFKERPAAIFGFHFFPQMEVGSARLHRQAFMAATEHFVITIKGRSAHACMPEKAIDAIQVAAHLILALNHLTTKNIDPIDPALISIGMINGGTTSNIIADQVTLTGTIRTLSPEQHQRLHTALIRVVNDLPKAFAAEAEIKISEVAPALVNDPRLCELMTDILSESRTISHFEDNGQPLLGGEDFARFAQEVPGCYLFFGCGNHERGIIHPLHSSLFDIDEKALDIALETLYAIALQDREIIDTLNEGK